MSYGRFSLVWQMKVNLLWNLICVLDSHSPSQERPRPPFTTASALDLSFSPPSRCASSLSPSPSSPSSLSPSSPLESPCSSSPKPHLFSQVGQDHNYTVCSSISECNFFSAVPCFKRHWDKTLHEYTRLTNVSLKYMTVFLIKKYYYLNALKNSKGTALQNWHFDVATFMPLILTISKWLYTGMDTWRWTWLPPLDHLLCDVLCKNPKPAASLVVI